MVSRRLCLVAALLAAVSFAESNRRSFRSIKAPKETVVNYEIVVPLIIHRDSEQAHSRELHVLVPTRSANYTLILEQNEAILSMGFTSLHYDDRGREVVTKGHVNCFYQGWVKDHPQWRVTMSTCHGLQGSFGDSNNETNFYHLEPLDAQDGSLEQLHAFYLDSEYKDKQGNCGSNHTHGISEPILWPSLDDGVRHYNRTRLRRQSSTNRYVELTVVNDNRQYIANGRNLSATVLRALSLINEVDTLYKQLSIRVVLTQSITWSSGDRFTISSDPNTLLNTFRDQQRNVISSQYDSAMLITGIDLDGSTVGIAFIGTMCSTTGSVGVTQDGGRSLSSTASTAAHELGHVFNMNHDDSTRQCTCADGNQGCIMAAISGFPPPTRWSSCSTSDLNSGFSTRNTDRCLSNVPTTTVGDPVCGNGIREGDEVCDCGSARECTDPCCNAATCQLASGAQCSAGSCCTSSCQFVSYGTQCRAATGDCDIAEHCPGDSGECPTDEHQRNGISCNSNQGYCNGGMCPTHSAQCQTAFGSNRGVDRCYTITNVRGDQFGNCGHTTTAFTACSTSNVFCGQLQCMSGNFLLRNLPVTTLTFTIGSDTCRSFTTQPDANMDIESPGLVEDGTRCGNNLVCLSQQCVSVSQIATEQCATAPNGQICSGNGVCNSRRRCTCNVGFTGANCETPFNGPGGAVNECNTGNGGCDQICTDTNTSFVCSCNSGYTLSSDGRTCTDNDECTAGTHNCQQRCVNTAGGFRCDCNSGFQLNSDQRTCSDINECTANTDGCQQVCTNTAGSFVCSCNSGYTLSSDGRTCLDNNECTAGTHNCQQQCVNTAGGFRCDCNFGFQLNSDQRTCSDINECTANTDDCQQVCTNTAGSFVCSCNSGYAFASDGRTCLDNNECTLGTHNCQQRCVNTAGGFRCDCNSGFQLNSDQRTCSDIDECANNNGGCQVFCFNSQGSYSCGCQDGFALLSDGQTCSDINECANNNGGCGGSCVNTPGSFQCLCPTGFQLAPDGLTCNNINECNVNNGGCNQRCIDSDGSFICSCRPGFTLSQDGRTCTAINACQEGSHNCDQLCSSNNDGTFTCSCESGYVLDANGMSCNDVNECEINGGGCTGSCVNSPGSFECTCSPGFQLGGNRISCVDVNECLQAEDNSCQQLCRNTVGSYLCECQNGFMLDSDGFSCNPVNGTSVSGTSNGGTDTSPPGSQSALIGAIAGGVVGGILLLIVVVIVVIVVVLVAMKNKDSKPYSGPPSYKPGYTNGFGITSSAASTRNGEVTVDIGASRDALLGDSYHSHTSSFTFTPAAPTSPSTFKYTPPPPSYHSLALSNPGHKSAPTSGRTAPQRPPTRKAPPAPKSNHSLSPTVQNEVGQHTAHFQNGHSVRPPPLIPPTKPSAPLKPSPLTSPSTSAAPAVQLRPAPTAPPKRDKPLDAVFPQRRQAPMAPPKAEKPSAPAIHDVPVKPQPALKPVPALKPTPAPKSGGVAVSTNDSASVPAPKPKPKPVVPAQKPGVKPDLSIVPPKPAVKPAGLDSRLNKPKPAPKPSAAPPSKPQLPTSTGGAPQTAKRPLVPQTKKPILPPPRQ